MKDLIKKLLNYNINKHLKALTKALHQKIIYDPNKTGHIDLKDGEVKQEFRGKLLFKDLENVRQASDQELLKKNLAFGVGGLDFDNVHYNMAFRKYIVQLGNYGTKDFDLLTLIPEETRIKRYTDAIRLNSDNLYFSNSSAAFVRNYIMPKILDNDGNIIVPKHKIPLASFSVGGREIIMIQNALRQILTQEYKVEHDKIGEIFNQFTALCIGYMPKLSFFDDSLHYFNQLIIFTTADTGVLRTLEDHNVICTADSIMSNEKLDRKFMVYQPTKNVFLTLLHHSVVPLEANGKLAGNFHSLPHYIKGIKSLPEEVQKGIRDYVNPNHDSEKEIIGDGSNEV